MKTDICPIYKIFHNCDNCSCEQHGETTDEETAWQKYQDETQLAGQEPIQQELTF